MTNTTETSGKNEQPVGIVAEAVAFIKTLIVILGLAFLIRVQVVEPFKIPSGSMIPTLEVGDYIIVLKFWYGLRIPFIKEPVVEWRTPSRGDVVVFTRPDDPATPHEDDSSIHIIKRVIGLPGDTVEVRGAQVFINGTKLEERYARWVAGGSLDGYFGPQQIPDGHVLLLGDNRDQSKDSRYWTNPFLDIKRIKGKAVLVFFSTYSLGRIGTLIR
jgi:signal peptidase I